MHQPQIIRRETNSTISLINDIICKYKLLITDLKG